MNKHKMNLPTSTLADQCAAAARALKAAKTPLPTAFPNAASQTTYFGGYAVNTTPAGGMWAFGDAYDAPWSIDEELEEMPEALAEKLESWDAVYVEDEREEDCVLWALSGTQAQWFHRESEIMSGTVFWFSGSSDAVYAKLAFGGSQ